MPEGGTLTLHTRREGPALSPALSPLPLDQRTRGGTKGEAEGEAWVAVGIEDTGIGIPLEMQEKIFRIGFSDWRNGQKGSGLGLYVARRNIENHGGRIEVASAVGEGTTVTVRLPIQSEDASPGATSANPLGG